MKVIHSIVNGEDPINYLGFEELADLGGDIIFFYGGLPHISCKENQKVPKYFFSSEEQTWDKDTTDVYVNYLDKIFTICPPSVTGRKKRELVFFPFNENYIPKSFSKEFDVIYTGFAKGHHVDEILRGISKFNYRFISFLTTPHVTNINVSYPEKIDFISKSKITVTHNLTGVGTPQVKTRIFEAAFCKSLILCKKDSWNVIENFFEEGTEFLYFENETDLTEKIQNVVDNYEDYIQIVENAYNKAINNYTTRHFVEKYLKY